MMTCKCILAAAAVGAFTLTAASIAEPPAGKGADAAKPVEKQPAPKAAARIGETAPDFTLTDTDGKSHTLSSLKGKIVVLEWFNPECPVIVAHHKDKNTFNPMFDAYGKDVAFLAINSGAPGNQGAGKEKSAKGIKDFGMKYPVLIDSDGKVGKTYGAKTTPHIFVVAADGSLAYMGAIDNQKEGKDYVNYAKQAIEELKAGKKVSVTETKAYGCSVKY